MIALSDPCPWNGYHQTPETIRHPKVQERLRAWAKMMGLAREAHTEAEVPY